jgi:peptide chain release factor 2
LSCGGIFDPASKQNRIRELDIISSEPGFWDDAETAGHVMKERTFLTSVLDQLADLGSSVDDIGLYLEMHAEDPEDTSSLSEAAAAVKSMTAVVKGLEIQRMLGGENDAADAVVTINSGAGGTDSQDWAEMLLRMYLRWAERHEFKVEIVDCQYGQEAGIKSAELRIMGQYAYGLLKAEAGVHRLVRISPFDSQGRRHTAFASFFCIPETDDTIVIEIDPKEIKVDTFRSSGAGGQHVNKTDSAIRITHLPTGTVVQCQNERSQHKNKATALKLLTAKLINLEREARAAETDAQNAQKRAIEWGSQIRSYVLYPYRLVKDLRTGVEHNDTDAVLDGDLDRFITAYLLHSGGATDKGGPD